jgi:hypothetical protein
MKNRFYGDKKDYLKYGLLDVIQKETGQSIGINWYLTDDESGNKNFGKDINYLVNNNWRSYNFQIYDKLKPRVDNKDRKVKYLTEDDVISVHKDYRDFLPEKVNSSDYLIARKQWHDNAKHKLEDCNLVFFDPDNGIKDKLPSDPIKASQYCTSKEVSEYDWCDWVIIQFLQHIKRYEQLNNNPIIPIARTKNMKVIAFIASSVAFLYISRNKIDLELLRVMFEKWDTKIHPQFLLL